MEDDLWFGVRRVAPSAVKQRRLRTGLSQAEFAAAVGVSRQTLSSIENRRSTPSVRLALAIALALEATVEELFDYAGPR